jgi:hypothetical protein
MHPVCVQGLSVWDMHSMAAGLLLLLLLLLRNVSQDSWGAKLASRYTMSSFAVTQAISCGQQRGHQLLTSEISGVQRRPQRWFKPGCL